MKSLIKKLMTKFVHWLDPKLDRFRTPKKKTPYTPKTEKDLIGILQRTPSDILTETQRIAIASSMSYQTVPVSKIMAKAEHVVSLHEDDVLGALTLDRLFKTGLTVFPVFDKSEQIVGVLRTDSIDPLKTVENATKLSDCIDRNICYVRGDYSLDMLLSAFIRTNNNFCIVVDHDGKIIGYVTLDMFIVKFFGEEIIDNFNLDADRIAVSRRTEK